MFKRAFTLENAGFTAITTGCFALFMSWYILVMVGVNFELDLWSALLIIPLIDLDGYVLPSMAVGVATLMSIPVGIFVFFARSAYGVVAHEP